MLICHLEVCQEGKGVSRREVTCRTLRVPDWRPEDMAIPEVMNDVFYPKEDTLKMSCPYLYWQCVRKGGSLRGVLGAH